MMRFLNILTPFSLIVMAAAVTDAPAQSNEAYILQDTQQAGVGNTLFIDQSDAAGSRIGTAQSPIEQRGGGNFAEIVLENRGAEGTTFLQSGASGQASGIFANSARITGGADARITLDQQGFGNEGTIVATDFGNTAELFQSGDENTGSVTVSGQFNTGRLEQIGNGNEYALNVQGFGLGASETAVVVTQQGDNLRQADLGGVGLDVTTNAAGTVFIRQTTP